MGKKDTGDKKVNIVFERKWPHIQKKDIGDKKVNYSV